MSLHSDVEALARALGVWRETGQQVFEHIASTSMMARDDGLAWLPPGGAANSLALPQCAPAWRTVDPSTAAIILLGHARGLRVDIGECPACRERGSKRGLAMWEWQQRKPTLLDNLALGLSGESQRVDMLTMKRACPVCTVDGEPTGRHLLAWERAILDAMPKPGSVHAYTEDHGELGHEPREDWSTPEPGDPATRTALTVLADQAQARGDKLGDMLAWWLAGPDVLDGHAYELSCALRAMAVDRHLAAV